MKTILILLISTYAYAHIDERVDSHAPISIMGDHLHSKGNSMLSSRYAESEMKDIYNNSDKMSENEYFDETMYMMAPKDMKMKMTMLGYMYGLTDKLNLSIMLNYVQNNMTMSPKMGDDKKTIKNSIGDTKTKLLYGHKYSKKSRLISKFGALIPTGKHDIKKDGNLIGLPMQTGIGSYGLSYGLLYTYFMDNSSVGADINYLYVLNENDEDYKVGDLIEGNFWYSYTLTENFSLNIGYNFISRQPYEIKDNSMMMPTLNDKNLHGTREFLKVGFNYLSSCEFLKDHRFAIDYATPVQRDLSGYQLARKSKVTLGWQKAF